MTKHRWKMCGYEENDEIDDFAYGVGYHNGPECVDCGFYFCQHCDPEGYETECGTPAIPGQASKLGGGYYMSEAIRGSMGLPPIGMNGEA